MLIDTHAHVQDSAYDEDRADVIKRAADAGVTMITVGVDLASSRAAAALAAQHDGIYAAVGLHPHEAATLSPTVIDELRRLCLHPRVVAIGETGLDWYRNLAPRQAQLDAFAAHLALAAELDLPVIVHNREADDDVLQLLRSASGVRGVMHAYSSDMATAQQAVELGLYVSFGGPLTYKNADETRRVAAGLPLERMLIETDCPYLPPVPWRGQRNEPAFLSLIAEALAGARHLDSQQVAQATTRNAQALFSLPGRVGGI